MIEFARVFEQPRTSAAPLDVDAARERIETLAHLMDSALRIRGTNIRFGADAALGLLPGVGNIATTIIAAFIVYEARRLGVSRIILLRMAGNVGLDSLISAVPLAGNVADVFFRANRRNVELMRRHFEQRAERARRVLNPNPRTKLAAAMPAASARISLPERYIVAATTGPAIQPAGPPLTASGKTEAAKMATGSASNPRRKRAVSGTRPMIQ